MFTDAMILTELCGALKIKYPYDNLVNNQEYCNSRSLLVRVLFSSNFVFI